MIDVEAIMVDIAMKYDLSDSELRKLRNFLESIEDNDHGYHEVITRKAIPPKRSDMVNTNTDEIYLPEREYTLLTYKGKSYGVAERGEEHKLHHHRLIFTKEPIDYADIQRRYGKYYYIHFEPIKTDTKTIKKVLEYILKQKKKKEVKE